MKTSKSLQLRRTALSVASSAVLLLTTFPAVAATPSANSSSNPLQGLMDWFNGQISSVQEYANGILNDKLKALGETISPEYEGIVSDVTGALGLPDPTQSRKKTEEVASNSDNILYSGDRVANEVDRQSARASASSILSQSGQEQLKKAYEQTQSSVQTIGQQSQAAQGEVVTQNVMKQIAQQNVESAKLMGGMQSSLLKNNEQQAQVNTQLTNMSRTMDGQTQAANAERVGAGFSNLGVASQAGLF
jgi:hypothetical protein